MSKTTVKDNSIQFTYTYTSSQTFKFIDKIEIYNNTICACVQQQHLYKEEYKWETASNIEIAIEWNMWNRAT